MDIIPREAWSQIEPRRIELTTPRRLFLHHSVGGAGVPDRDDDGDSGDDYLRIVERHHIETNGWDDIAYNFAIDPIGLEVYELQGWGREPNAQAGFNEGTWAVVIIGDFRSDHRHPDNYPGLLERIAELVAYGQTIGELPDVALEGHRDAPGSEGNHCPGDNLYASLSEINRLIEEDDMQPPDWAVPATKWHIDRGIYKEAAPSDVDESMEFHRQTVFRHRFYEAIKGELGGSDLTEDQVRAIVNGSQIVAPD